MIMSHYDDYDPHSTENEPEWETSGFASVMGLDDNQQTESTSADQG
jgi:predicted RNA-binding protein with PUA-like domain